MQAISSNLLNGKTSERCEECFRTLCAEKQNTIPLSTYRVQFNNRFHFEDARRLVPYLRRLGISHLYASPILKAREGSQHGYDIIDHNQVNPELGTEAEFRQLVSELKSGGMGLLLDIVPNHMGVGRGDNPWWQDVLQNGRTSSYADFFDIDWEPLKPELRNKVLLPILGNPYGEDLEARNIRVAFEDGRFVIRYFDKVLPVDPQTFPLVFAAAMGDHRNEQPGPSVAQLSSLLSKFGRLPTNEAQDPAEVRRRQDEIPPLLALLQCLSKDSAVHAYVQEVLGGLNGIAANPRSFDALHNLLEKQPYRLAFWRVSGEEINYRRFFDINDLVGLRMENTRLFAETHRLIRRFLAEGLVSGLRLDHPDGLLNPSQYIMRLQRLFVASRCVGAEPIPPLAADGIELDVHAALGQLEQREAPLYILVEKILEAGERLPEFWPVDGSVGYDFANAVNGVFIDRGNGEAFTKLYERVIGGNVQIEQLIYQSKKRVMLRALASEINVLAHMLNEISNQDRRARDYTLNALREAIRETIACFPVYRTYIDERSHISESDSTYIKQAIVCAKQKNQPVAPAVFDFLQNILLLKGPDIDSTIFGYRRQLYFTLKFQQLTGPVMAKGLEDTVFYVYARFIASNEVGGSPAEFGTTLFQFHRGNQERAKYWPNAMLATSTHDSKRSEDVRARLDVISEMPTAWATQVMKWRRINRSRKAELANRRIVPDDNEEYFLYQTLIGSWPLVMETEEQRTAYLIRIQQYIEKALHEAKVNLSWLNPNPEYVAGVNSFLDRILSPAFGRKPNLFWDSLQKFISPIMYFGAINSLAQTVLKLTCPGMPDVYQGQEMWDFSLVDPDNRRPVDFSMRERALEELLAFAEGGDPAELCRDLIRNYKDGRLKLWVTSCALNFRRNHPDLFQQGAYLPLEGRRGREEHLVAFAREFGEEVAIVAVPRLSYIMMRGREEPPVGAVWGESELPLPSIAQRRSLHNIFTGERVLAGESILCRELFASFPVALFTTD